MDRELLAAALRVLTLRLDGRRMESEDVDLLRAHAILRERDYEPDDLACRIIQRISIRPPVNETTFAPVEAG
jgi:hypothetical protein